MSVSKRILVCLIGLLFVVFGCDKKSGLGPDEPVNYERGDVISSQTFQIYSPALLNQMIDLAGFEVPYQLVFSVEVVSIIYQTIDYEGNPVPASGAIMIPEGQGNLPILSIQHGTETKRDMVASVNPLNSIEGAVGLVTASLGYLTCVPDYLGFGISEMIHPYVHARSLATCVVDFIRAAKSYCSDNEIGLSGQLFLAGYSEGGYATLATQKEIEENYWSELPLMAVAPMAGPYDLEETVRTVLQEQTYGPLLYIAYIYTAYDVIYGWDRFEEIFNPPYGSIMQDLFDGSRSTGQIYAQLPGDFSDLMNQDFVDNYLSGNEPEIQAVFQENTLLDWAPVTPIRFFHGNADEAVPYQNSLTALQNLTDSGGTSVELITIEGGTHATSSIPAVLGVVEWFNGYRDSQ